MKELLLVTGNPKKLDEWQQIVPDTIRLDTLDVDLPEIQSDDPIEIVSDKVRQAYAIAKKPVVVEDVSAGLDRLGGLPGPYIKTFMKRLGSGALFILAGEQEAAATVSCVAAYYDGDTFLTARGDVQGTVIRPKFDDGSFRPSFIPNGQTQTYSEMTSELKNSLSHRSIAIKKLLTLIEEQVLGD